MKDLLSPKQVARAICVSESSLKRWCDQGLIETVRTAGGHRKLPIRDVIRFLRERKHTVVCPEVLGMPCCSPQSSLGLSKGRASLTEALIDGNESLARQIVFDLYMAKHSISVICDEVICGAFQTIRERAGDQVVDIYQERRGCEIATRILFELRRSQPEPDANWKACGGTLEGDLYSLSSTMSELVLRNAGWDATTLGTNIPAESMVKAIQQMKPRLFWVYVSRICDPEKFVREFKQLSEVTEAAGVAIAIGGRALTEEIRKQITFCCYFDTMQHLESFAKTVRRISSLLQ